MKYLILAILSVQIGFAQISPVKKGDAAPEDGFFITKEQEKKFRQINEDKKATESINISLKDLQIQQDEKITLLEQRRVLYKERSDEMAKEIQSLRTDTFFGRTVYFIGGIVVTGAIGYIAMKYGKR